VRQTRRFDQLKARPPCSCARPHPARGSGGEQRDHWWRERRVRSRRGGQLDQHIRLDLALYPGFSGGPLLNAEAKSLASIRGVWLREGP